MLKRAFLSVLVLLAGALSAHAETDAEKQARLKRLLEEKFGSEPQTRGLPVPKKLDDSDVYVIRPDGSVRKPGGRSELTRGLTVLAAARGDVRDDSDGYIVLAADEPPASTAPPARGPTGGWDGLAAAAHLVSRTLEKQHDRDKSGSPMVVKRNSYVIQLKPDATSEQIDDLISKFNLRVIRNVPSLGVLYCASAEPKAAPAEGATRSVQPAPAPQSLQAALEPKVIVDLRKHPAVDAAFVNSTIAPKSVPKKSGAKALDNGNAFRWTGRLPRRTTATGALRSSACPPSGPSSIASARSTPSGQGHASLCSIVALDRTSRSLMATCGAGYRRTRCRRIAAAATARTSPALSVPLLARHGRGRHGPARPHRGRSDLARTAHRRRQRWRDRRGAQHVAFFMDAIVDLSEYLDAVPASSTERRVVNISLAYNWAAVALGAKSNPTADRVIRDQVRQHAKVVQSFVNRLKDRVLFVAAAGNDSDALPEPATSEFASVRICRHARGSRLLRKQEHRHRRGQGPHG